MSAPVARLDWQVHRGMLGAGAVVAVASGVVAAYGGPEVTALITAGLLGLVAGAWLIGHPYRALLVYAFVLSLDVYLSTTLRFTTSQVLQVCIFTGFCLRTLLLGDDSGSAKRLPATSRRLGLALLVFLLVSLSWSINLDAAARSFLRISAAIIMAALVAVSVRNGHQLRRLIVAMCLGAGVTAIYGYLQYARGYDALYQYFSPFYDTPFVDRGGGFAIVATFANPNILAGYGVMILPLTWSRVAESSGQRRLAWLGMSLLLAGMVLLTFSKASWIIVAMLATLWLLARMRVAPRLLLVGAGGVALSVVLFYFEPLLETLLFLFPDTRQASVDPRLALWRAALGVFVEQPLLGHGLEGFAAATITARTGYLANLVRAHNMFLQTLVDLGIVGSLLLWGTLVPVMTGGLRALRAHAESPDTRTHLALLLSAASVFIYGMVDDQNASNQYVNTFWMVFGLLAASTRLMYESSRAPAPR